MFIVYTMQYDYCGYGYYEIVGQEAIQYELNTDSGEWAVPGTLNLED